METSTISSLKTSQCKKGYNYWLLQLIAECLLATSLLQNKFRDEHELVNLIRNNGSFIMAISLSLAITAFFTTMC